MVSEILPPLVARPASLLPTFLLSLAFVCGRRHVLGLPLVSSLCPFIVLPGLRVSQLAVYLHLRTRVPSLLGMKMIMRLDTPQVLRI